MNLISSSGSDLVEDDDNDGRDGLSQRHAPQSEGKTIDRREIRSRDCTPSSHIL